MRRVARNMVSNLPEQRLEQQADSSVGRAPLLHGGGRRFESCSAYHALQAVSGFEASFAKRSFPSRCPCAKKG
jgi:hypothetical protein